MKHGVETCREPARRKYLARMTISPSGLSDAAWDALIRSCNRSEFVRAAIEEYVGHRTLIEEVSKMRATMVRIEEALSRLEGRGLVAAPGPSSQAGPPDKATSRQLAALASWGGGDDD